jgi:hypothetical protein
MGELEGLNEKQFSEEDLGATTLCKKALIADPILVCSATQISKHYLQSSLAMRRPLLHKRWHEEPPQAFGATQ